VKLGVKRHFQRDRLYEKLTNPVTYDKYRAYLDLLRILKDIPRSCGFLLPHDIKGYKIKASQDSQGNLLLDVFYRRQNFLKLHLKYGFVKSVDFPLVRVPVVNTWLEGYYNSSIMSCIEVLQKYDDVSEPPISWDFTGNYKQLKSKYICSDGVTRYEKL
jgi:hypothetical protein